MMQQPYTMHPNPTRARISCYNTSSPFLGTNFIWFSTSKLTFFLTSIPHYSTPSIESYEMLCMVRKERWPLCKTTFHLCLVQAAALNRLLFTIQLAWDMALALLTFPWIWGGSLPIKATTLSPWWQMQFVPLKHQQHGARTRTHTHSPNSPWITSILNKIWQPYINNNTS